MKKTLIIFILLFSCIILFVISNQKENEVIISNINNNIEGLVFYLQSEEESEEYISVDTIPSKDEGYVFSKAVCNDNSEVLFNNYTWSLEVSNMENGKIRCKLYFDIDDAIARRYILSQNTVNEEIPNFNTIATTNEGIFISEDDIGTTYYWRGDVDDNYFYFAGYYWRIIRINGDGSIRLIYQGIGTDSTGDNANATTAPWHSLTNDNAYIGYMYGNANSSTYEDTHVNINNSDIKVSLDEWYNSNLESYSEYLADVGFCGDRSLSSGTGIGSTTTYYNASNRLSNNNPTFKCMNQNDLYTVDNELGNGALTYPIGLITADEVVFAGGVTTGEGGKANENYYLYTGSNYRTMTPYAFASYNGSMYTQLFGIDSTGVIRRFWSSSGTQGVRPVINIKKSVELEGTGTAKDPYRIIDTDLEDLLAKNLILANKEIKTRSLPFTTSTTVTDTTTGVIYKAQDDWGDTYYFAGNPTDNWVKFAGYYWRIIRINGDGSIRLIYNGTSTATTGSSTMINSLQAFNPSYNRSEYVGYMYTSGQQHGNTADSSIKNVLDNWYSSNLAGQSDKISTEAGFCGDREMASGYSWSSTGSTHYYAGYGRLAQNSNGVNPTFKCSNSNDLYTTSTSSKGNKKLSNPIGLITVDEVVMAGGAWNSGNSSYYLYNNAAYWTMSPFYFNVGSGGSWAIMFGVRSTGYLDAPDVSNAGGVRPVINLARDVEITGSGTSSAPYVVVA